MKLFKWLGSLIVIYVLFVVIFEGGYLGIMQPSFEERGIPMLVLTTNDEHGDADSSMLARFETNGKLYVSAHHWTRGWYRRAITNPAVQVEIDGMKSRRVAIPVLGQEFDEISAAYKLPLPARFLMGFPPPRDILRLDPAD